MLETALDVKADKRAIAPMSFIGLVLMAAVLAVFASLLTRIFIGRLGHDQTTYLVEVPRLLAGSTLYGPHLSETNPPFIVWFTALPVMLAHLVQGSPALFLKLLVLAMVFGSVAWCVTILHRASSLAKPAIVLLGCAVLAIELGIGSYDFGQREHLLIILLLPYILAVATGAAYRLSFAERFALGVAAGIAIWFKPQDVIIPIGLELFASFRTHSLRRILTPEVLSLILTSSFVLALVRVITPLYFSKALPLLLDTYWAFGTANTLTLALSLHPYMLAVIVMLLVCIIFRNSLRQPATVLALVMCSIAASFAFDIQHTDWDYHRYPHLALLQLAMVYLFIDLLHPVMGKFPSESFFTRKTALVVSGLMAGLLCAMAIHPRFAFIRPRRAEPVNELDQFLAQCQPATTVYVFSTGIPALSSAYNHGLNWGSRFAHLWMLPAIVQNELGAPDPNAPFKRLPPKTLATLGTLQRTETAEDLNYWYPSVVLVQLCSVQHSCQGIPGRNFDMLSWFLKSPDFAAVWSHYKKQPGLTGFDVYKLDSPVREPQ
jgi:hypothetical protein